METTLKNPFSNIQLELLKLFADNIPEEDLQEIKHYLIQYRAKKLMDWADTIWEEKEWTKKDEERLLHTHKRTPYKAQNDFLDKQNKTAE